MQMQIKRRKGRRALAPTHIYIYNSLQKTDHLSFRPCISKGQHSQPKQHSNDFSFI